MAHEAEVGGLCPNVAHLEPSIGQPHFAHTWGYTLLMQPFQPPHDIRAHMNLASPRIPEGKTEGTKMPSLRKTLSFMVQIRPAGQAWAKFYIPGGERPAL